ncbi:MAG: DNA primase [Burkholderiales bacterium]|nr:DNA primase [Burkholderiales bacterium]
MIPQSFIADLLNRVDVVDVVGRHVQLKKGGANLMGLCPFHNEKSPSFTVSPTKQFYHCFGCGAHGSAIGFLMEYSGMSYVEAIRDLAQSVGLTVPEERGGESVRRDGPDSEAISDALEKANRFYRDALKGAPAAIDYLKRRGLSGKIAARFGLGFAPDAWNALEAVFGADYGGKLLLDTGLVIDGDKGRRYDRFRGRVTFPIRNTRGRLIGFGGRVIGDGEPKYLNSPETPVFEKGRELYGLFEARQAIREAGRAVVVEGYMDVVALAQHGVGHAVATLGTACTPAHVQKLVRQTDRVTFCFDGDAAGRRAAWRALENSLALASDDKVFAFLFLPPEHDPDSYVREFGSEAFAELEAGAMPLSRFLIETLKADADLDSAEGRAGLVSAARTHLQRIAAPGLRLGLVKAVAELAGMTPAEVERLCDLKPQASVLRSAPVRSPRAAITPLDEHMLRLLVRECGLARLPEVAQGLHAIPEDSPVRDVIDAIAAAPEVPSPAALVESFAGTPAEQFLRRAQVEALEIEKEPEVVRAEFLHALRSLVAQWRARRREELVGRVADDPAARQEFAALLAADAAPR